MSTRRDGDRQACGDTAEAEPGIRAAELIFLALHQI